MHTVFHLGVTGLEVTPTTSLTVGNPSFRSIAAIRLFKLRHILTVSTDSVTVLTLTVIVPSLENEEGDAKDLCYHSASLTLN